jgi:hypothetical protein
MNNFRGKAKRIGKGTRVTGPFGSDPFARGSQPPPPPGGGTNPRQVNPYMANMAANFKKNYDGLVTDPKYALAQQGANYAKE